MLVEVKVPQLPESVSEATLATWHKKEGDFVEYGQNLVDIETDKVVLEVVAPADQGGQSTPPLIDLGKKAAGAAAAKALKNNVTNDTPPEIPQPANPINTPLSNALTGRVGVAGDQPQIPTLTNNATDLSSTPTLTSQTSPTKGGGFQIARASPGAGGNTELMLNRGMADQVISGDRQVAITVPADAFATTNPDARIQLSVQQTNGQPLPGWLKFDSQAGTFSGMPPQGLSGAITVKLMARDDQGREVVSVFKIKVEAAPKAQKQGGAGNSGAVKSLTPDTSGSSTQAVRAVSDAALGTIESHLEAEPRDTSTVSP